MSVRVVILALAGAVAMLAVPAAGAKEFKPGDVNLCNKSACVPVMDAAATEALENLVYTGPQPARAPRVFIGARYYQLRFPNGYTFGIVARAHLDRFLSYGVVLERFKRGSWYRVPPVAAAELRRLARALAPMRLTSAALAKSR
jgi:hypothetical protein